MPAEHDHQVTCSLVKTIDTDFPLVTCRKPEELRGCITGTLEGQQRSVTLVTASAEACRFFRPNEVAKTHMMNRSALIFSLFLSLTALASTAVAQSNSVSKANPANEKGFASYTEFGGTADSDGQVYSLDSSVGYNFNRASERIWDCPFIL